MISKDISKTLIWDDLGLSSPHSGIGSYGRNLSQQLLSFGWTPRLFNGLEIGEALLTGGLSENKFPLPQVRPYFLPQGSIVHGLSNINGPVIKLKRGVRSVITIHDLIPVLTSDSSRYGILFKALYKQVAKSADRVIAVSQWTKEALVREGISEEKIRVIPNGFPPWTAPSETAKEHLLCVARYEVYKNLEFFAKISEYMGLKAVLVTDARGAQRMKGMFSNLCESGQLVIKSSLEQSELSDLYRKAFVLVHPSLYEGFCLPAAEANAHGVPVVFHKGSGIDETVEFGEGNVGYHVEEWAQVIARWIDVRPSQELTQKIMQRTWAKAAESLAQVYNDLRGEML
ncbi:MAG: glycosyltransferase [Pseudomonadota bacterium]